MKKPKGDDPAIRLQMTPLIDVTFLILIFLMVLPFKTLEKKLSANLPKDRGMDHRILDFPPEAKITVTLKRAMGDKQTRVVLLDRPVGVDEGGFRALDRAVLDIARRAPEMPGEIDAWPDVPHQDVIRTLDSFMKARVKEVRFIGIPPAGRGR